MSSYHIDLSKCPDGHSVPTVLAAFADWLATQDHAAVGYFDALKLAAIPKEWHEEKAAKLQRAGYSFLHLPDGSLLALLDTGVLDAPRAVVLLDSEGDARTVATSMEDFFMKLARATTGVSDLDDASASKGRAALASWIEAKKITAPNAPAFDFAAWLAAD